jgi:outer membrane protein assembly factor BamB
MVRALFVILLLTRSLVASDWPQWRGPHRDGTSAENGLLEKWPKDGPPLLWNIDTLGSGFSGPAVVGDSLFIMGSDGTTEFLAAMAVGTGRERWRVKLGPEFKNGWGNGPRGTPTLSTDSVVALGAQGVLVCVDTTTGKERWRADLRKDHAGQLMKGNILDVDWGYSESPLVDDGRVLVSPGGKKGAVAAFDLKTGKLLWRTTAITDAASYSSIVAAEIHGTRQYVQLTGGVEFSTGAFMKAPPRVVGIKPEDGSILWQNKIHYTTAGVINTPVVLGDIVYSTCGYGAGCTILRIDKSDKGWNAVDITSKDARKVMATYHGGIVPAKDRVYGYSDIAGWVCQAIPSGELLWEEKRKVAGGSHIRVGQHLIILTLDGAIFMTKPNDYGWIAEGDFVLPKVSPSRKANGNIKVCTHPVVANGRLYVRDQEQLYCYDLRKSPRN